MLKNGARHNTELAVGFQRQQEQAPRVYVKHRACSDRKTVSGRRAKPVGPGRKEVIFFGVFAFKARERVKGRRLQSPPRWTLPPMVMMALRCRQTLGRNQPQPRACKWRPSRQRQRRSRPCACLAAFPVVPVCVCVCDMTWLASSRLHLSHTWCQRMVCVCI